VWVRWSRLGRHRREFAGETHWLAQRITDLLEPRGLVNDASGLLALEFGLAILVRHEAPSMGFAIWRLFI